LCHFCLQLIEGLKICLIRSEIFLDQLSLLLLILYVYLYPDISPPASTYFPIISKPFASLMLKAEKISYG